MTRVDEHGMVIQYETSATNSTWANTSMTMLSPVTGQCEYMSGFFWLMEYDPCDSTKGPTKGNTPHRTCCHCHPESNGKPRRCTLHGLDQCQGYTCEFKGNKCGVTSYTPPSSTRLRLVTDRSWLAIMEALKDEKVVNEILPEILPKLDEDKKSPDDVKRVLAAMSGSGKFLELRKRICYFLQVHYTAEARPPTTYEIQKSMESATWAEIKKAGRL
mmetsp:Transcript_125204/g.203392  ORF Transcript_125204/g.203392 Transcript_125204/m.203392 type:complete len:216 (+) Transcript_125204:2-649(+)